MSAYGTSAEQTKPLMIDHPSLYAEAETEIRSPWMRAGLAVSMVTLAVGGVVAMMNIGESEGHMLGSSLADPEPAVLASDEATTSITSANDSTYFQCPQGSYLGHTDKDLRAKNEMLAKLQAKLAAKGYEVNDRESKYAVYAERGYATYESPAWVKPSECSTLPDEEWTESNNKYYYQYQPDRAPVYITKQVFNEYHFEFHDNWKVASTSFGSYLPCEYGSADSVSMESDVPEGYKTVAAVRNPLSRFASAVGELLQRSVNHYCPVGYCQEKDSYGTNTLDKLAHQTTWYNMICNSTELVYNDEEGHFETKPTCSFDMDLLPEVVTAFVHDKTCNYYSYAAEHFTSQAAFVTQQSGGAKALDVVLRLEEVDEGLAELATTLGKDGMSCSMGSSNSASNKPGGVPSESEIIAVLEAIPELMVDLCTIYAQDYICFDYDLPDACADIFD